MTKKRYQKGLGPARKPSPRTCVDSKPQNSGQLFNFSNWSVSNNICHVCGGDHNVLVISLENGGRIVTPPFPKDRSTRVKVPSNMLLRDIFGQEEGDI